MSDELPEGWVDATLSAVTSSVASVSPESEPQRLFGYVDISAIDRAANKIDASSLRTFLGADAPSRARRPVVAGDVLFSNVRTNLRNVAVVPLGLPAQLASTGFTVLRPNGAVLSPYLLRWCVSDAFVGAISETQTGTHYPATSDKQVLAQRIMLPPLAEQHRIVAKVEELLEEVNQAKARLTKVQAILKRFRQSVLAAACSGELTREWRDQHPTARVSAPDNTVGDDELENSDAFASLPESWAWTALDDACEAVIDYRGRTPPPSDSGRIPQVRTTHVRHGRIDWNVDTFVTRDVYDQYMTRGIPRRGDVLFTMEAPLGEAAVVDRDERFSLAQRILLLRGKADLLAGQFFALERRSG